MQTFHRLARPLSYGQRQSFTTDYNPNIESDCDESFVESDDDDDKFVNVRTRRGMIARGGLGFTIVNLLSLTHILTKNILHEFFFGIRLHAKNRSDIISTNVYMKGFDSLPYNALIKESTSVRVM